MTRTGTAVSEGTEASVAQDRTAQDGTAVPAPRAGDWVIAGSLLALFVVAFVLAQDWPFRAALFPMLIAAAGALAAVIKLLALSVTTIRSRRAGQGAAIVPSERAADLPALPVDSSPEAVNIRTAAVAAEEKRAAGRVGDQPADLQIVDDDQEDDESLEYIFATAGARAWAASLAWIAAFFVSFFVLGAYLTVPLFALFYLRFAGRASWLGAAAYAVVTGAIIYLIFNHVVFLPLPQAVFPFLQL